MKKRSILIAFMTIAGIFAAGQERITTRATSVDDLNEVLASSRYLFPEFQDARVILRNESLSVKMNYNALSGEMEYLDETGTPLSLWNKNDVRAIVFSNRIFKYIPKGYVEILSEMSSDVELLVHRMFKEGDRKKIGAFGIATNTSPIASISQVTSDAGVHNLSIAEEVSYYKTHTYYLYASGTYRLANKSGFKKVFGKQRPDMEEYLKSHPVNFTKAEDIIRLFTYCTESPDR